MLLIVCNTCDFGTALSLVRLCFSFALALLWICFSFALALV